MKLKSLPTFVKNSEVVKVSPPKFAIGDKVFVVDKDAPSDGWGQFFVTGIFLDVYLDDRPGAQERNIVDGGVTWLYTVGDDLGHYWKTGSGIECQTYYEFELAK